MARCFVEYSSQLLPTFVNNLCGVRVWDSSSRSLVLLTGNGLADFWLSLDKAIFKAVAGFFMSKWYELAMNFSVSFFSQLEPGEGLSALCGGDFVDACAKAGTSSSSCFDSITGGMGVHVSPHGGDSVDLFGLEVLPEVRGMFDVLICEISTLARRTYSSVIRAQVMDALSRLSGYEQCAWLTTNTMLYKTSFVANCLAEYYDSLCPGFIYSLFSVRPGCTSGRGLLSLIGKDLGNFGLHLSGAIVRAVKGIFVADWGRLTSLFSVSLGPGEGSSSTTVGDFINACRRVGLPALAISGTRGRVAQISVSQC